MSFAQRALKRSVLLVAILAATVLIAPTASAFYPFTHYRAGLQMTSGWGVTGEYWTYFQRGMVFADMDATSRDKLPVNVEFDGFQFTQSLHHFYAGTSASRGFSHGMYAHARMDDLVDNYLNPKRYDVVPAYYIDTWHGIPSSLWPLSNREEVFDWFVYKMIGGGDHNPTIDTSVWTAIYWQLLHQRLLRDRGNPVLSIGELDKAKSRFADCFGCSPPGWIQWGQLLFWLDHPRAHFSDAELQKWRDLFNYIVSWAAKLQVPAPLSGERYLRTFDYQDNAAGSDPWLIGFDMSASTLGIGTRSLIIGDTLYVKFRVRHAGTSAVTLQNLFVVGRLNGGGNYDFGYQGSFFFAPGDRRTVDVSRTLPYSGTWTFYIGYKYQNTWRAIWDSSVSVTVSTSGGGGGSPYVAVWNGRGFEPENNILPGGEDPTRPEFDVTDYYTFPRPLVPFGEDYVVQIQEFETERTSIDAVRLVGVRAPEGYRVAVDSTGTFHTFKDPSRPLSAIDSEDRDVSREIAKRDDGKYVKQDPGYFVVLDFGPVSGQEAKIVMQVDAPAKRSLRLSYLSARGNWTEFDIIHPRVRWSLEISDVSPYLTDISGNLRIRVYWTDTHAVDWIALDTSPDRRLEKYEFTLASAQHSVSGDVKALVDAVDLAYVTTSPGERLTLTFRIDRELDEATTFVLTTVGHVEKLPG